MRLIRFSVERYRSIIQKSTLEIGDKTVIIGPNNEGKSNVLRALVVALRVLEAFSSRTHMLRVDTVLSYYVLQYLKHRKDIVFDWENDYPHSLLYSNPRDCLKKPITFCLDFKLTDKEQNEFLQKTSIKKISEVLSVTISIFLDRVSVVAYVEHHNFFKESDIIEISFFITRHIDICYIDAVRTASTAYESIRRLLSIETTGIDTSLQYRKCIRIIEKLYNDKFGEISGRVTESLKIFVPSISQTLIELPRDSYDDFGFIDIKDNVNVSINDGEITPLEQKGSGIQSLIALALAHSMSINPSKSENFILAIEEPEAHLHPKAIHEIKKVLSDIASRNQLIITTHSPLLVETTDPHKNIIVKENIAVEASKIAEIRNVLGVIPADNLSSAELVLIVEGAADENILPHLLGLQSQILKEALDQGRLVVSSCGGTHNMDNYVRFIRHQLCSIHVFVDDDESGRQTISNMKNSRNIEDSEYTILRMSGVSNSEIENMVDPDVYADAIEQKYGIPKDAIVQIKDSKAEWKQFMRDLFKEQGKEWNEDIVDDLKTIVSQLVKSCDNVKLIEWRARTFLAGCRQLERKLNHEE